MPRTPTAAVTAIAIQAGLPRARSRSPSAVSASASTSSAANAMTSDSRFQARTCGDSSSAMSVEIPPIVPTANAITAIAPAAAIRRRRSDAPAPAIPVDSRTTIAATRPAMAANPIDAWKPSARIGVVAK